MPSTGNRSPDITNTTRDNQKKKRKRRLILIVSEPYPELSRGAGAVSYLKRDLRVAERRDFASLKKCLQLI